MLMLEISLIIILILKLYLLVDIQLIIKLEKFLLILKHLEQYTQNYEYTDYRAQYDIARLISDKDWSFNSTTKKLTIADREILKKNRIAAYEENQFYQVSYKYVKSVCLVIILAMHLDNIPNLFNNIY
jgi:hypothetical protein